jgi:hypothetical protein
MLAHLITAISFTAWAYLLWAHLPQAFRLQPKPGLVPKKAFKRSWAAAGRPGVMLTVMALFLALIQLSSN